MNKKIIKRFEKTFGKENTLSDDISRYCHSYDATNRIYIPHLVVIPQSVELITEALKICRDERIPLIPRGAGSGFTGGSLPIKGGVVLCLDEITAIELRKNPYPHIMAETGAITSDIQEYAKQQGMFYPPDPASQDFSTIGGNVAVGAGGPRCLKYGTTRDFVIGLDVVFGTGEERELRIWNGAEDTELISLLTGSEGTLGVITRVYLRIVPPPQDSRTMMLRFSNAQDTMQTVADIISMGITPARLEFIDERCVEAMRGYTAFEVERGSYLLLIEEDGDLEDIETAFEKIKGLKDKGIIRDIRTASSDEEAEALWDMRRAISPSLARYGPTKVNEDITVPIDRLVELLDEIEKVSEEEDIFIANFGHIGDGNVHMNIMADKRDPELMKRAYRAVEKMFRTTVRLGGTITGEHGVGIVKMPYLGFEKSEREIEIYKNIKKRFDPVDILNPGKFFYGGTLEISN
jgi:glycolate oxidase